jgi:two-component system, NarL family, invasion response regulator UvrY
VPAEGALRVLVVDDQAAFRRAATLLLRTAAGLTMVGEAASGEEAIVLCQSLEPDLVLMDVRLPGITGPEATRRILAERPGTRIILMSTYEPADLPADLDNCGAERFLRKQDIDIATLRT